VARTSDVRTRSFGQGYAPSPVDRFGVWLSARWLRTQIPSFAGKRVGDFGCGYHATFVRTVIDLVERAVLIDLAIAEDLKRHPKVTAIEGSMPEVLKLIEPESLDVVLCVSVLEHLWEPLEALTHFRRVLTPGGVCLVNVPSWRGKAFLEFSAFRLGLSPREEMDDHKSYYDPRDLWPLLVRAGFTPHLIHCARHKFGLNTFAVCRKGEVGTIKKEEQDIPAQNRSLESTTAVPFSETYLDETAAIVSRVDRGQIERLATGLANVRDRGGRLFIVGVGGSAGHASHAVNDFRKICGLETYTPTDNVSELTARVNDDGWETTFSSWLRGSRIGERDALLVLSVGGGSREKNVSVNVVNALELARAAGAAVYGIVGRDGGFTAQVADACVIVPPLYPERVTAHTEGVCAVIWHLLVSHPLLQREQMKWESTR
jgi:D-sedoheptulose 7-phosphate isomerase